MAHECPHCSKPLEGFVTQEKMTERLNAKEGENKLLRDKVTALTGKVSELSASGEELARTKAELTGLTRKLKLSEHGISDPEVIAAMEAIYKSVTDGAEDAPAFEDLDKWAKEHVLLKGYFTEKETAPTPKPGDPKVPPAKIPKDDGQPPPPPQGKLTPTQLREYFRSAEFTSKPAEEQRTEMERLRAEYSAGA